MIKTDSKVILNFWDVLQFQIWDDVCKLKGYGEDFIFAPAYETDYSFELTKEEFNSIAIKETNIA